MTQRWGEGSGREGTTAAHLRPPLVEEARDGAVSLSVGG